ncbi:MAG: hypothetical protein IJW86_06420 [Clostridia bacterium]|nr:hypothetical protein [Clostridia bacterium]
MNRTVIKYIAVAAMLIDHIGLLFVPISTPLGTAMRVIGRLTAPIMCFFLAEGFTHTSSKKKYGMRLFAFALISQIPFIYMMKGYFWVAHFNFIATLFLCFMILLTLEKVENILLKVVIIACLASLGYFCDWGLMAPLWVMCFYLCKDNKKQMALWYSVLCAFWVIRCCVVGFDNGADWYDSLWQLGSFGALPILYSYNGEGGKTGKFTKWFFYWFYPVHLLVLGIIFRT